MRKKQLIILGFLILTIVGLPLTLIVLNQQQEIRSRAENSSKLYFSPSSSDSSPLQTQIGDVLSLDIMLNPGTNAVSLAKLEIIYDTTKFEVSNGFFEPNLSAFPQIVEAPIYSQGKITATISIGTDISKVITQISRVGTLKLKALNSTNTNEIPSSVSFGPNSQIIALGTNAGANENVLSNSQPALITVNQAPIPTCAPKPACLNETPQCLIPEPAGGWCPLPTPTMPPLPTPIAKCSNAAADAIIIIDKSGSMNDRIGTSKTTKIASARDAAGKFIDILSIDTQNKIGLISFNSKAVLNPPLTNNYTQVKNLISSLTSGGYTCHQCAINKANQEFTSNGRQNIKKVAILLTDGKANWIDGGTTRVSQAIAEQKALESIKNTSIPNKIVFYTIGLGNEVNSAFLKQIADTTGGKYYTSPTAEDLQKIYQEITQALAKGSVSGFVFNDANKNGAYDQGEAKLPNWTLYNQMTNYTGPQPQPTPAPHHSDSTGSFNIGNLCDGAFTLKEITEQGWTQSTPVNPDEHSFVISGGNAVTGKNFGNYNTEPTATPKPPTPTQCVQPTPPYCPNGKIVPVTPTSPLCAQFICVTNTITPTPTPASQGTMLLINGLLDGIGARGDNSNPDGKFSNKNPLTPKRNIALNIYNASNQLITSANGELNYSSQSGKFSGKVSITESLPSGNYTIKASTDNHLTRQLPGIQQIKLGQENILQDAIFIAGDITKDNMIDIRDYNSLIDCYSDLAPATACTDTQKKTGADFNDDGDVNQFDYNLFLREIATQPGQ